MIEMEEDEKKYSLKMKDLQKSEFSNNRHNEEFTPILTFVYDQRYYEINNKKFYLGKNAFDEINVFDFSAKMIINCLEETLPSHKLFIVVGHI